MIKKPTAKNTLSRLPMARLTILAAALSTAMSLSAETLSVETLPVETRGIRQTLDWVPLSALTDEQRDALSPGSCGAYISPIRDDPEASLTPNSAPIRAEADQSSLYQTSSRNDGNPEDKQVVLIGDVVITQGYRQIKTNRAQLDQGASTLVMEGELELREPGLLVLGDNATVNQQQSTLEVNNANYVLHQQSIRGTAQKIEKTSTNQLNLDKASFTQCEPGNNVWLLKGSQIILDRDSRQGHAKHVRLIVKGIPVFYFPYLRFPLGDERLSGFLAPTFVQKDESFNVSIPYYFNLAPNYDLIFTPHFLQSHGTLYEGNFRHLSRRFFTQINLAHLSDDRGKIDDDDQSLIDNGTVTEEDVVPFKDEDRWAVNIDQVGGQGQPWSTRIDYTKASDIDYYRDFDTKTIEPQDDDFLNQKFLTGYRWDNWQLDVNAIRYQLLSETITEPYRQLPEVSFDGNYSFGQLEQSNWSVDLEHELIRFDHSDADDPNPILTGDRLRTNYRLGWDFEPEWGFFRPAIQAKHLQYWLEDNNFVSGADESPSITVPQATIDSGLFFERDGNGYLQTFEPRLFYFYSDFEDHSKLFDLTTNNQDIDFDTSELTFSYSQLFRDTRFSGGDRIDDANQLAIGLTTRFFGNESGREWFSASVGQIKYFDDRRVTLNNSVQEDSRSAVALQLASNPAEHWRLSSDLLYDDDTDKIDQGNVKLRYQNDTKHLFELNYRYTRGTSDANRVEQVDAALIAPLFNDRWHLLLYSAYDTFRDRELDTISAIEYNGCCYRVRVGYRAEIDDALVGTIPDSDLEYDYDAFLEFHFKGLGGTSKQLDTILDENIDGYAEWQAIYD